MPTLILLLLLVGGVAGHRNAQGARVSDEGLESILEVMQSLLKSVESDESDGSKTYKKKMDEWEATLKAKADSVKSAQNDLVALKEDVEETTTEAADYATQLQMTKQSVSAIDQEIEDTQKSLDLHRAKCIRERTGTKASMMEIQSALAQEKTQERYERRSLKQLRSLNKRLRHAALEPATPRGLGSDETRLLELQSSVIDEREGGVSLLQTSSSSSSAVTRKTVTRENVLRTEYRRFETMLPEEQSECKKEESNLQDLIVQKKSSLRQMKRELESFTKLNAETQSKLSGLQLDVKDRERIIKRDQGVEDAVTRERDSYEENSKAVSTARADVIASLNEVIDAMGSYLHPSSIAAVAEFSRLARSAPPPQAAAGAAAASPTPMSFLQFESSDRGNAGLKRGTLQDYLTTSSYGSPVALALAQTAAASGESDGTAATAGADPFASVKDMIKSLISAAKQKQNEEMGHADWCNQEKEKNKNAKTSKKDTLDMLSAEIRTHTGTIVDLEQQIKFSTEENQRIAEELSKMKATHAQEAEAMKTTIGDYGLAIQAVEQATGLLQNAFGIPATGMLQGASGHTVGTPTKIMENVGELETKFLALKQLLTAAMNEGDVLHETVVKDAEEARRAWAKSLSDATSEKSMKEELLLNAKADRKNGETELEGINNYLDDLGVQCGPQMVDYDAAKKRREEEIEALQDAYKVLIGETIPTGGESGASAALLHVAAMRAPTLAATVQVPESSRLSLGQMVSALREARGSTADWESQILQTQAATR